MTVIHGECLGIMRGMADASVQAVVADPPYGTGEWQRPESGLGKVPKAVYTRAEWDVWDTAWLDQACRVSSGPVAFFVPIKELPSGIAYAAKTGEPWRLMAWCKSDPMPTFSRQVAFGLDPIIVLRANLASGGKDWCEGSSPKQKAGVDRRDHPHQKPFRVIRWLCQMMPEGTILDPFGGSGTTAVACLKTGHDCVIVESDEQYIPVIRRRLAAASTPLFAGLAGGGEGC